MSVLLADVTLALGAFKLAVSQEIPLSGVTALFGRSGSGKTTLLRIIAGLEPRADGRIAVNGEVWQDASGFTPAHRRPIGYVFQDGRLFGHLDVAGNLDFAARRAGSDAGPKLAAVVQALDLAPLMARRVQALSGGEKQRVAIARALLGAPRLLLMDEPLSSLDEARKGEILPYLERVRDEMQIPILYVSHSAGEVARLANTVVMLDAGKVVRMSAAGEFFADADAVPLLGVREAGAVLTGRIAAHHEDGLSEIAISSGHLILPQIGQPVGTTIRVRIPAQDILLATQRPQGISALNVLAATVLSIRQGDGPGDGAGALVSLQCGEDRLLARITRRSAAALGLEPGSACFAIVKSVAVAQGNIGPRFGGYGGDSA
jgi:molybdate transport system ATP-binding protein